eukprot:gene9266-biopygen21213
MNFARCLPPSQGEGGIPRRRENGKYDLHGVVLGEGGVPLRDVLVPHSLPSAKSEKVKRMTVFFTSMQDTHRRLVDGTGAHAPKQDSMATSALGLKSAGLAKQSVVTLGVCRLIAKLWSGVEVIHTPPLGHLLGPGVSPPRGCCKSVIPQNKPHNWVGACDRTTDWAVGTENTVAPAQFTVEIRPLTVAH